DLHSGCVNGPTFDLPTTVSKFLLMGMPLDEAIRLATSGPAGIIDREPMLGTLGVGAPGDIAVFGQDDTETVFTDAMGQQRTGSRGLVLRHTVTRGRLWGRPFPHPYL
ncbi:MAG: amidohydrolase family protein, partial [Chloroflexia bacterium]|nr:amidohydrolase family protein [Chloroflexia bacterium]